jgi:hypothetical protein
MVHTAVAFTPWNHTLRTLSAMGSTVMHNPAIRNMKSMNCRGETAGVELALIAALLPAPSRPMWPQNGVRQAGTTSFVQNQNVARLSHPYGLDHISNC